MAVPVIFLAFANDLLDGDRLLRHLAREAASVRASLQHVDKKLCEVVVYQNVTLDQIATVFNDAQYRGRIAIFHYGGHANSYQLLLQEADGRTAAIGAAGLSRFLGMQPNLQLVFLNGCATEPQSRELNQHGVPLVIATSTSIDDKIAADFATRFYQALAAGVHVRDAFEQATSLTEAQSGGSPRKLYAEGAQASDDRWPWQLHPGVGSELSLEWNLPKAAGDPLFDLPQLPQLSLPDNPFDRALSGYTREQAELFFGRSREIRELYLRIVMDTASPVVLFYGQSGVGKSSLLEAGLLPRLEQTTAVRYARRDREAGLLQTLCRLLNPAGVTTNDSENNAQPAGAAATIDGGEQIRAAWQAAETQLGKPLVLILDQVEEVFTRPNRQIPSELAGFMAAVHSVFATQDKRPRGRLLLSFRKEHLAEISEQVKQNRIDVTRVLLAPLDRAAVIEVVRGPADAPRLKAKYNLTVEPDLAERIADDLTADPESPVATVLQLLLTKLWAAAREEATAAPVFSHQLYAQLQRSGLHLGAFVDEQLAALEQMWPTTKETENPVRSGYVLDLLTFHTTDHGTAEHRLLSEVEGQYGHRGDWQEIVQRTKDVRLLADRPGDSPDQEMLQGTRLAHDTVAPLVRGRFAESDAPGQRARRILETRVVDYAHGDRDTYLDDADLAIVEAGERGMRLWATDEQGLIQDSQHERDARRRRALIVRVMALAAVVAILLSSAVAWWLYGESQRQRDQALINDSRRLAGLSIQELATDPVVALHLALAGLPSQGQTRPRVPEAEAALRQSVLESRERRYVRTELVAASQIALHRGIIAVGGTGLTLYDTQLNEIAGRDLISATVDGVRWHPDDDRLLAWSGSDLFVIDGSAIVAQHTLPDFAPVLCAQWQPGGNVIALCAGDALVLWEVDDDALTQVAPTLEFEDSATFPREAVWSHDGRYLAGWGARLVIWDNRARRMVADRHDTARAQGFVASAQWTPADEALVAHWDGERSFTVWTPADDEARIVNLPGADTSEGRAEDEDALEALRIALAGSDRVVVLNQHRGQLSLVGLDGRQIGSPMALQVGLFANMAMAPDAAGVSVYGAGSVQVGAIESLAGAAGSEGFSGFSTFYQSSGGGTEVKEVFWIDQEQLVVQTGDGFVRGYWMESALNLSEVKLPAVEPSASLAGVWLTPEGELLTATYSGVEGSSLRLWQVAPKATTPGELAALSDQPICSQLRRILVYPGSEDSGAAWSDVSWPAADVFMAMDIHGAVARWQSGGSDPLALAQAASPVFATLPGASGNEVLRILEQDAELWRVAFEQWQRALLIPGTYRAGAWAGDKLALLDGDGVVHVSSHDGSETFGEIPATDDPVLVMDTSSDGHWLALKHSSGRLSLYSLRENPPKLEAAWEIPFAVQPGTIDVHPTEPLVLHARPGQLGIWRAGRESPVWTYTSLREGQLLSVQEARWSPDGARMALAGISSTDFGGEVELLGWDGRAQTVELLQHVRGSRPRWSPQGDYLLVSLDAATQRVVPVWPDERRLFEDAHNPCVLTRPLSDSQKRVYVLNEAQ